MARGKSFATNPAVGSLAQMNPATIASTYAQPWGMALSPHALDSGKSLYVACSSGNGVVAYNRDINTGILTLLASYATGGGRNNRKVAVSYDGKYVYSTQFSNLDIAIWSRNLTTGALTAGTAKAVAAQPWGMCISPDDGYLYTVSVTGAVLSQFSRNASTGALTALSPATVSITTGTGPQGMAITPNGAHIYVACNNGYISHFTRDTGTGLCTFAENISANEGAASGWPAELCVSPEGTHLYCALDTAAKIGQYSISAGTGALTALSPAALGSSQGLSLNGPWGIDITPDGLNVYLVCSDGNYIAMFRRNISTGLLTANLTCPAYAKSYQAIGISTANGVSSSVAGPYQIIVSGDGHHAYVPMSGSTELVQYNIRQ